MHGAQDSGDGWANSRRVPRGDLAVLSKGDRVSAKDMKAEHPQAPGYAWQLEPVQGLPNGSSRKEPLCSWRMLGQLVLGGMLLLGCTPLLGQPLPHVDPFTQLPASAKGDWLRGRRLKLEPFVSGSVHTPVTMSALPWQFHRRYPDARSYRPWWARERDAAEFLHDEIHGAVARRLQARVPNVVLLARAERPELRRHYHLSGNLALGGFRPVLFDRRAEPLGDASTGSDRFAPFRKAFVVAKVPLTTDALRLVTGYIGLDCVHELVGRRNIDRKSTAVHWLVALVDNDGQVVAQVYVETASEQWECPVSGDAWSELLDSLAEQLIEAVIVPRL